MPLTILEFLDPTILILTDHGLFTPQRISKKYRLISWEKQGNSITFSNVPILDIGTFFYYGNSLRVKSPVWLRYHIFPERTRILSEKGLIYPTGFKRALFPVDYASVLVCNIDNASKTIWMSSKSGKHLTKETILGKKYFGREEGLRSSVFHLSLEERKELIKRFFYGRGLREGKLYIRTTRLLQPDALLLTQLVYSIINTHIKFNSTRMNTRIHLAIPIEDFKKIFSIQALDNSPKSVRIRGFYASNNIPLQSYNFITKTNNYVAGGLLLTQAPESQLP